MVHRGPARGCLKCKERHVKCDLERPSCRRCLKKNLPCPGYRHEVDVILRDQTSSVIRQYQERTSVTTCDRRVFPYSQSVTPTLESRALSFFFSKAVPSSTGSHLDFLVPLYQSASSYSTLAHATIWLSVVVLGTCSKGKPYVKERFLLSQALESTRAALRDPENCLKDDVLASILVLQHGEGYRGQRYRGVLPSAVHQDGAEALIAQRRSLVFGDEAAVKLYEAARRNAIDFALYGSKKIANLDLLFSSRHDAFPNSHTPAQELDTHAANIIVAMYQYETGEETSELLSSTPMHEMLLSTMESLSSWDCRVPKDWLPQKVSPLSVTYPSPDVAYLFTRWYLLSLKTFHLLLKSNPNVGATPYQYESATGWLDSIIAAEPSFLVADAEQQPMSELDVPSSGFPHCTVQQCRAATGRGARLFDEILGKMCHDISTALETSQLPAHISTEYFKRLSWVQRERETMRKAFPLQQV